MRHDHDTPTLVVFGNSLSDNGTLMPIDWDGRFPDLSVKGATVCRTANATTDQIFGGRNEIEHDDLFHCSDSDRRHS